MKRFLTGLGTALGAMLLMVLGAMLLLAQGDASLQSVLRNVAGLVDGTYGSGTESAVVTINRQGRVTAIAEVPIQFPPVPPASGFSPMQHSIAGKDLTVGVGCAIPATVGCNVRFNSNTVTYMSPTVFRLVSGTGTLRVYVDKTGSVIGTASGGVVVTCFSGPCAVVSLPAIPYDAIPLYEFTSTSGNWDAAYRDLRSALSTFNIQPGFGAYMTSLPGSVTLGVDRSALKGVKTCTNVATCTILGTEHGMASARVNVQCWTPDGVRDRMIAPLDVYVNRTTFDVEVVMDQPRTFTCLVM
jgi:hypothetical protein